MNAEGVDLADLPESLAELARLIGLAPALALVRARGGVRIYIPLEVETLPGHWLAETVGWHGAVAMVERFGGDGHYLVPKALKAFQQARNRRLVAQYLAGRSQRDLALAYGLSERQVCAIVAAAGADRDAAQAELF